MERRALLGRDRELEVVGEVTSGLHAALLLTGDPGIGKSQLLLEAAALARTRHVQVLAAAGVESEAQLPFAGVHQLVHPLLDGADRLAPRQRAALLAAFGLSDDRAPDLFLIALATLSLLGDAAPILLVVDDVQWLDNASARVLAFVARRLESDPIALVAAMRSGYESPLEESGLRQLTLTPLDETAAAALLDRDASGLDRAVRRRLLEDAAGNPLALVELPQRLDEDGRLLEPWLPLTSRLERAFAARFAELPPATRALLTVAALNDSEALGEALAAAAQPVEALTPALEARLVESGFGAVHFRHPLVRSAIHQATPVAQRRSAHLALAEVLADDPDRRVWHRAAASTAPDETIAVELEAAADRAQRRQGAAAAVMALERAAQLTPDAAARGERLLRAAELAFELGRRDVVLRLLDETQPLELDPLQNGRRRWLRELFGEGLRSDRGSVEPLIALADALRLAGDTSRALDALQTVAWIFWWSNAAWETREAAVAAAEAMPVSEDDPKLLAVLAFSAPLERGAGVLARLAGVTAEGDPESLRLLSTATTALGDLESTAVFAAAAVDGLRAEGRLALLTRALVSGAWASILLGRWSDARTAADEAGRLARETAQPRWAVSALLIESIVAGLRGDHDAAERTADEVERSLLPTGAKAMLTLVQLSRGGAALSAGRPADAFAALRRMFDPADVAHHPVLCWWAIVDFVDAAVQTGRHDEAVSALEDAARVAAATGSPLITASVRCARALVAPEDDAFAIDVSTWPFLRARLLLAHGVWLRRQRRGIESRDPLRMAQEAFDALGASTWSERASQELRATGETSRRAANAQPDELTPQELQIARLAAGGLSNREIADKLFLSHRTIGSHLYRIFPKLGITSRTQLGRALQPQD
jgi:DNA-binding CsgD family transcriptional regulator